MAEEKLPPHDIEAEEAVIGSLLIDPEAILKIAASLRADDFSSETNRAIYQACLSIYERSNEVINQITVAHELMRQDKLEQIGGAAFLSHLIGNVPTSLHVEYYAQIVSNTAIMRRLIVAARQIEALGYQAGPDVEASLNDAEDILFKVRGRQGLRGLVPIREALGQYFEVAGPTTARAGEIPHILTGFTGLDDFLGGLQRTDLIVLAAKTSLGKTSLALNIARNAAINQKACIALFSLEMSRDAVVQRLLASESGVDSKKIRLRRFGEKDEAKIMEASGVLSEAPIYVDDSPKLRVADLRSNARRLHFERGIDLIIIDYLQLIQGDSKNETRVQELSTITRALKTLARELNVPVLALSQLSRAIEARPSHMPQLSDLRESGSIEQDADVVIFIHREDLNYTTEDWSRVHDIESEPYPRGIADIIIAKHRNGPQGQVKLRFLDRVVKFSNVEAEPISAF
jgi:replicative DNA helicase